MALGIALSIGGVKLGFGSFHSPKPGFMPVLLGILLAVLALIDLISGSMGKWKAIIGEKNAWADTNWVKLCLTAGVLLAYVVFFNTLGFIVSTMLLLLFLFQGLQRRSWWIGICLSVGITVLFYFGFKTGLDCQLPDGIFGF